MIKNFLTIQIEYLVSYKNLIPFKQLCHSINKKIELESKCIFNQFSCIKLNSMVYQISCVQAFSSTDGYFYHTFNVKDEFNKMLQISTLVSKKFHGLKRHIKYIQDKYKDNNFLKEFQVNKDEIEKQEFFDII